jgi:hypothetical protein
MPIMSYTWSTNIADNYQRFAINNTSTQQSKCAMHTRSSMIRYETHNMPGPFTWQSCNVHTPLTHRCQSNTHLLHRRYLCTTSRLPTTIQCVFINYFSSTQVVPFPSAKRHLLRHQPPSSSVCRCSTFNVSAYRFPHNIVFCMCHSHFASTWDKKQSYLHMLIIDTALVTIQHYTIMIPFQCMHTTWIPYPLRYTVIPTNTNKKRITTIACIRASVCLSQNRWQLVTRPKISLLLLFYENGESFGKTAPLTV